MLKQTIYAVCFEQNGTCSVRDQLGAGPRESSHLSFGIGAAPRAADVRLVHVRAVASPALRKACAMGRSRLASWLVATHAVRRRGIGVSKRGQRRSRLVERHLGLRERDVVSGPGFRQLPSVPAALCFGVEPRDLAAWPAARGHGGEGAGRDRKAPRAANGECVREPSQPIISPDGAMRRREARGASRIRVRPRRQAGIPRLQTGAVRRMLVPNSSAAA